MTHTTRTNAWEFPRTLTKTRRSTSAKLAGCDIGETFAAATVAAEATVLARPKSARRAGDRKDLRRLADKARRVAS